MAFFAINENGSSPGPRKCSSNIDYSTRIKLNGNATYRTDSPVSNVATYTSNRYFDDSDASLMKTNRSDDVQIFVPPLAFDRNSTFSKECLTYTNRKDDHHHNHLLKDDHHHLRNTEAYKEWLSAKLESKKNAERKKIEDEQRLQQARKEQESYRRRLREFKLKEWFEKKQAEAIEHLEELRLQQIQEVPPPTDSLAPAKNYTAWLNKKKLYQKALREKRKRENHLKNEYDRRRKELADSEYANWLKTAKDKPKPVPLNQGFFSLKGTISSIYINPVPWVSNLDNETQGY